MKRTKIKFALPYGSVVKDIRRWKKGYRYVVTAPPGWTFHRGTTMMTDLPRWGEITEMRSLYKMMRKT